MNVTSTFLPILLAAGTLAASDLDLYLLSSTLSPRSESREGTIDPLSGKFLGKVTLRGGDLRQLGLGGAYTVLSPGNWRVRVGAEANTGASRMPMSFRYLRFQGITEYAAATDGTVKLSTFAPLLSLVYVSAGAGEYGITYEHHFSRITYDVSNNVVVVADVLQPNVPLSRSQRTSDPFLSLNATFVQRYRAFGFFARVSYGINLASVRTLQDLTQSDFLGTNEGLLEMVRPKQEMKLALGTRF